jgi:hypothetical protein
VTFGQFLLEGIAAMAEILVGLVIILLGAVVTLAGLRVFFAAIPIWGFIVGFFVGSAAITYLAGDGFLSTALGWIVGAVIGVIFAALAFLYWYIGAILTAGSAGALIGSALMALLNVESGWIVFLVALAVAALFMVVAVAIALPIYVVIINTALAGATAVIAGFMLVFDVISLEGLSWGAAWAMVNESWFWMIAWIIVAAFGLSVQLRSASLTILPEQRWEQSRPAV